MKGFFEWLNEETSHISIGYTDLTKALNQRYDHLLDYIKERQYQTSIFQTDKWLKEIEQKLAHYPLLPNLLRALQSKNIHYIMDQYAKIREWLNVQPYKQTENLRDLTYKIWTYIDTFKPNDNDAAEKQLKEKVSEAIAGTQKEMEKVRQLITGAISRIAWKGSHVHIEAQPAEDEQGILIEPNDSAYITIGRGEFAPSFSLFNIDDKMIIDDVIEADETDFFPNSEIKSDYFGLINELRNPGSTTKGRILTLYTARPKKDRQQLLSSTTLPVNIFLTNDFSHAEGLSIEYGQERDIWKIRIDSKYLTQTLDGPVKYYQVTVPDAPAKLSLL